MAAKKSRAGRTFHLTTVGGKSAVNVTSTDNGFTGAATFGPKVKVELKADSLSGLLKAIHAAVASEQAAALSEYDRKNFETAMREAARGAGEFFAE